MSSLGKPNVYEKHEVGMPEALEGWIFCPLVGDWIDRCPEECCGCDVAGGDA